MAKFTACRKCSHREPGCHANCADYAAERESYDAAKPKPECYDAIALLIAGQRRMKRRRGKR